jgi:hypothetical protein
LSQRCAKQQPPVTVMACPRGWECMLYWHQAQT